MFLWIKNKGNVFVYYTNSELLRFIKQKTYSTKITHEIDYFKSYDTLLQKTIMSNLI